MKYENDYFVIKTDGTKYRIFGKVGKPEMETERLDRAIETFEDLTENFDGEDTSDWKTLEIASEEESDD